jgi:hypothetical protein
MKGNIIGKTNRLSEMSRIGKFDTYTVVVYTDDPDYIPHIHVIDSNSYGNDLDVCVRLDKPEYFSHGRHQDIFNSKQKKIFNDFMHEPSRNVHYRNNYEMAINLWNDNNSESYIQIKEDEYGNIIVPDYTQL